MLMSFEKFLLYKGSSIRDATREEAFYYVKQHGQQTRIADWFWRSPERDAFWKAIYWSEQATDKENGLHSRCSAVRKARVQWSLFQNCVVPVQTKMPMVPPLPE